MADLPANFKEYLLPRDAISQAAAAPCTHEGSCNCGRLC